jgi:hypothetical protein
MELRGYIHAPAALPPIKNPRTHAVGDWRSPRTGEDVLQKRRMFLPGFVPRTVEPVA